MQGFPLVYSPYAPMMAAFLIPVILLIVLWTIIIKGYALWHAARAGQKWWFIALLVINTVGILEVIYLIWFRTKNGATDTEKEKKHETPVTVSSSAP